MLPYSTKSTPGKWATRALGVDATVRDRAPELLPARVAMRQPAPLLVLDRGQPWIVCPYEMDPYTQPDGGYPFPPKVRSSLEDLLRRVDFDDLAVAHELDPAGPAKSLLGRIPPQGLLCDDKATRRLIGPLPNTKGAQRMAGALDTSSKALAVTVAAAPLLIVAAADAAAAAPLALLAGLGGQLDPILLGIKDVTGDKASPSLFYPLAAWVF